MSGAVVTQRHEGELGTPMPITTVHHRERAVIEGTVVATGLAFIGGTASCVCTLSDGGGEIDLLFLGRTEVPGLHAGARCIAQGTARLMHDRLVIWNPLYEFEQG